MSRRGVLAPMWSALLIGLASLPAWANPPIKPVPVPDKASSEQEVARRIDELLMRLTGSETPLPPLVDDLTFLRRVSLDLTGKLPTPEEQKAFVADTSPDKRAKLIDQLLASEAYAINWGRYWRDVLTYYSPASANYLRWAAWDKWVTDQVRRNRPWSEFVTALVTAYGTNDEAPPVNFYTSHYGNMIEVASTTSRVFLGVQLQCAQCHDAKTEPFKREQFHEFVAFWGRARLIERKDVQGRGTPYTIESKTDQQHLMSDKKDPNRMHEMEPRFLTGEALPMDSTDEDRRTTLARIITSPKNPYFSRAHVNRMWTALMGWGFYPGLAEIGSGMPPRYGELLDLIAGEWIAAGFDQHWLFRTLTSTEAYQRQVQPRVPFDGNVSASVCPVPLRPEQIFEALVRALGFNENDRNIPAPAPKSFPSIDRHTGLRHMVYMAFKFDPSSPFEEVQGTIPQALLMMNSALVNTFTAAKGKTFLADALSREMSDDDILVALYERTLARKPTSEEMEVCQRHLKKVENREEALEDIFWGLINSAEFLYKR